jgi:methionyl-tRNA synthetase
MHDFPFLNSPFAPKLAVLIIPLVLLVIAWTIIIKGCALWNAARGGQKGWFIALLVVNTLGILEVIYLIWFRSRAPSAGESAPIISSTVQS